MTYLSLTYGPNGTQSLHWRTHRIGVGVIPKTVKLFQTRGEFYYFFGSKLHTYNLKYTHFHINIYYCNHRSSPVSINRGVGTRQSLRGCRSPFGAILRQDSELLVPDSISQVYRIYTNGVCV